MEKKKTRSAKRVNTAKTSLVKEVVQRAVSMARSTSGKKVSAQELADRIAFKAYEIYERRGYSNGNDLGDWYEAERLVKAELGL
ncbi:MAG: DUF2934 domain-containing protein [Elusimicrobia bacterium]|nr:DUF2934 domain-containing protein [Elusimicrobiota bacterium]